eukprot:TRINITY_DN5853_c0_g1_i1.p1 TRINITY_DN5853_c0_g1~~TRINITY_DN5853_c0_g1_i1.p1  ORF type:complete len:722 (+),score=174.61 TRINITY_DN5853_c0_g1_i1:152-2317(+)
MAAASDGSGAGGEGGGVQMTPQLPPLIPAEELQRRPSAPRNSDNTTSTVTTERTHPAADPHSPIDTPAADPHSPIDRPAARRATSTGGSHSAKQSGRGNPLDAMSRTASAGPGSPSVGSPQRSLPRPSFIAVAADSDTESYEAAEESAGGLSARQRLYVLLEHPSSGAGAYVLSLLTMLMILASSVTLLVETLPALERRHQREWHILEIIFVAYFSADYVLRLIAAPDRLGFVRNAMNVLDLFSVLPFYLQQLTQAEAVPVDLRILRLFRVTRVFRIFKVRRLTAAMAVVAQVLRASEDVLILGGFMLCIAIVVFSTCVFYAERDISQFNRTDGLWYRKIPVQDVWEVSPFQSVIHTFWWCIVTIMTVGYGDDVPASPLGKSFATLCMLGGLIILSLPTSVIASNFLRMHKLKMKYGADWQHYLTPNGQDRMKQLGDDDDPLKAAESTLPMVLNAVDDLEHQRLLSAVYATWARKLVRDPEFNQDAVLLFMAAQHAVSDAEMKARFARNISELVEEYAQVHAHAAHLRAIASTSSKQRQSSSSLRDSPPHLSGADDSIHRWRPFGVRDTISSWPVSSPSHEAAVKRRSKGSSTLPSRGTTRSSALLRERTASAGSFGRQWHESVSLPRESTVFSELSQQRYGSYRGPPRRSIEVPNLAAAAAQFTALRISSSPDVQLPVEALCTSPVSHRPRSPGHTAQRSPRKQGGPPSHGGSSCGSAEA